MTHQEFDKRLDEIAYNLFMAGLGSAGMDDIEDAEERDRAIINMQRHYTAVAKQAITDLFLSIVGDDEDEMILNINDACSAEDRNQLRQQLRTTITGKEGGDDR